MLRDAARGIAPLPHRVDVLVVGAGLIGLATARSLLEMSPDLSVCVLEKESAPARHQSGRNSGVIHAGLAYRAGSLKARFALAGRRALLDFCRDHGVPFEICGKVIVATTDDEARRLPALRVQGHANGLRGAEVLSLQRDAGSGWTVATTCGDLTAAILVNCAGLQSDRLARMAGEHPALRIVAFRGEYFSLRGGREDVVNGLVYPLADPRFPILGVHLTRTIDGTVLAGPTAAPALARDSYQRGAVCARDLWDAASYPGSWRFLARHLATVVRELRQSFDLHRFTTAVQRLVPSLVCDDFVPHPAGHRAQAVMPDGRLVEDFVIAARHAAVHVLNAPSPGATAALSFGAEVARQAVAGLARPPRHVTAAGSAS